MTRKKQEIVKELSFLERMQATRPTSADVELARQDYADKGLPDDVIEEVARQQAAARPVLDQYHMLHERTPTVAMARAAKMQEIDSISDMFTTMNLMNLDDMGELEPEYTCPRCAHRWSGAPNYRTGYGGKVYVPNGKVSRSGFTTGNLYGGPRLAMGQPNQATKGRDWKYARPSVLPRGFGNAPIGTPLVFGNWKQPYRGAPNAASQDD